MKQILFICNKTLILLEYRVSSLTAEYYLYNNVNFHLDNEKWYGTCFVEAKGKKLPTAIKTIINNSTN